MAAPPKTDRNARNMPAARLATLLLTCLGDSGASRSTTPASASAGADANDLLNALREPDDEDASAMSLLGAGGRAACLSSGLEDTVKLTVALEGGA